MDKMKPILAAIKKHHFWIISGLVVIVAMTFWACARGDLVSRYDTREKKLKDLNDKVGKVTQQADPANDKVIKKIEECKQRLDVEVYKTWEVAYKDQQEKNPWPEELGDRFLQVIKSLEEDKATPPEKQDIPREERETYQNFIKLYFPKLLKIIDLRLQVPKVRGKAVKIDDFIAETVLKTSAGGSGGMMSSTPGMAGPGPMMGYSDGQGSARGDIEWIGLVEWDENDWRRMVGRFMWHQAPTTLQVRLGQEDLWVYKALLEIIRNTNGAARYSDLPIKRIEALQIGQDAAMAFDRAEGRLVQVGAMGGSGFGPGASSMPGGMSGMPSMSGSGPGGPMMPGSTGPPPGYMSSPAGGSPRGPSGPPGMSGGPPGMGMTSGGSGAEMLNPAQRLARDLNHYRYVDPKGKPLAADAKPPFAEFKMPVYMRLTIDQEKVSNLLVECANSTMPVEVHRVSVCPGEGAKVSLNLGGSSGGSSMPGMPSGMSSGSSSPTTYSSGPPGMGMGMGPSMPSSSMGSSPYEMASGMSPGSGAAPGQRETGTYIPIEVLGIIYIFNPPDPKKLGTGALGEMARGGAAPSSPVAPLPVEPLTAPAETAPARGPAGAAPTTPPPAGSAPATPPPAGSAPATPPAPAAATAAPAGGT
jgi:hypothetical protein